MTRPRQDRPGAGLGALLALLALAACAPGAKIAPPPLPPPPPPPAPPPAVLEEVPMPPLIPLPPPQAGDLLGLAAAQVTARLGPAGFSRREQSAQVWHYNGKDCQLWVFLYEDAPGGVYRVAHVEAHGRGGNQDAVLADGDRCYTSLLSGSP